ncbi:hypothetical protein BD309DRAFT_957222 [Dichomitus squalens]|nr:hypothetical protein BD309DRAFT_957222 [Dichomitus squalens]
MESMFRHAVNLVDLRFPALEDFPGILHGATFRLWSLTTTGMAFGVLHQWENSVPPARDSNCYSMYSPVEKLRSLRILDLDLKGIWCSAKSLHTTFCQYSITHLTLRGTADRSLADDLLPLMAERLVSLRLVLAARDQELLPWTDIWPTQILGKTELPALKHFELSLCPGSIHRSKRSSPSIIPGRQHAQSSRHSSGDHLRTIYNYSASEGHPGPVSTTLFLGTTLRSLPVGHRWNDSNGLGWRWDSTAMLHAWPTPVGNEAVLSKRLPSFLRIENRRFHHHQRLLPIPYPLLS